MSITFMAKFNEREGNSCHIHCSLADEDGGERLRRRPGAVRPLRRRPARLHAGADAALRAARQLLQALRHGLVRADRGRLGPRQPHLLAARGRPRRGRCGSRTGCRAPTSTPTWRWRDDRRRPARDRRTSSSSSRPSRATPTSPTSRACRTTSTTPATRSRASEVAREAFGAGGRRPLPEPGPGRARGLRGGGHRLGALPGLRAALMAARPVDRDLRRGRARLAGASGTATR